MCTYRSTAFVLLLDIFPTVSSLPVSFTAATVPPENVNAVQADDQTVRVSWSAIPSDRQPFVDSDITHYEVQYWSVGGAVQEPTNVQNAMSNSLAVNLTYQRNNEMVLAARVRGVTQLRREPDSFGSGPWSEVIYSDPVPPRKCQQTPWVLRVTTAKLVLSYRTRKNFREPKISRIAVFKGGHKYSRH